MTKSKPTILFLSDVDYFKGGAERSLFDAMAAPAIMPILAAPASGPLTAEAQKRGIKTATLDFGAVLKVHRPFRARSIALSFKSALNAARALKRLAKHHGCTAIHTNGLKAHGVACLARLIGGPPVIVHYRAIPYTPLEKLFWKITQIIAAQVILVSRPCWPGRALPRNTSVIFNGIDLAAMPTLAPRAQNGKALTLGFIGRIHPSKGLHHLIDWFAYARENSLDLKLMIRGAAAPQDKAYETEIRRKAQETGLSERIVFDGNKDSYCEIYDGIDVNVVPSVTPDPLPRSCMEANALGIPVLGYPAGGIPFMIDHGVNGFLIRDEREFCAALQRLTEEDGLYETISAAAIQNAENRFSLTALHAALADVYAAVLAR